MTYAMNKKIKLIEIYGGMCEKCGYNGNYASLSFHHEDETLSQQKQKDNKGHTIAFVNTKLAKEILKKGIPDKRIHLFCANCHMEEHHPTWIMPRK